jgi:transcriptional regulator with XRE-family HTH domain
MTAEPVNCWQVYGLSPIKVNETPMNKPAQLELVGRKIRQLRRQRKLTQVELADRIGVHQSDLSRMEQGEYKVGLDTLLKILGTFDLSIGDFFDESARSESVVQKYRSLSPNAQKEVESFIEFKRAQEEDGSWDSDSGESEGDDV